MLLFVLAVCCTADDDFKAGLPTRPAYQQAGLYRAVHTGLPPSPLGQHAKTPAASSTRPAPKPRRKPQPNPTQPALAPPRPGVAALQVVAPADGSEAQLPFTEPGVSVNSPSPSASSSSSASTAPAPASPEEAASTSAAAAAAGDGGSGPSISGLPTDQAKAAMIEWLKATGKGDRCVRVHTGAYVGVGVGVRGGCAGGAGARPAAGGGGVGCCCRAHVHVAGRTFLHALLLLAGLSLVVRARSRLAAWGIWHACSARGTCGTHTPCVLGCTRLALACMPLPSLT